MTSINTKKPLNGGENIYNMKNNGPQSMFERYYAEKIRSKSPSSSIRPFEVNKDYENIYETKNDINTEIKNIKIENKLEIKSENEKKLVEEVKRQKSMNEELKIYISKNGNNANNDSSNNSAENKKNIEIKLSKK